MCKNEQVIWGQAANNVRHSTYKSKRFFWAVPTKIASTGGDTQCLYFRPEDEVPFWLTPEDRERKRYDVLKEGTKMIRKQSVQGLEQKWIIANGKAAELKKIAKNNFILTIFQEQKKEEGWEGKPKGMLQVLWEQGWVDEQQWQDYTVNGKKDTLGSTINETSLKYLLRNCNDFINEESMLQYYGRLMGVTFNQTPKCHCEMAGEGIEYSWVAAKNKYRRFPVSTKKGKEHF
jgi:hypothetical protein